MHKFPIFFLLTVVALAACSGDTDLADVAADNPHIRYTGRWNFDDTKSPWVGWQGSTVSVRFRGSEIGAHIDLGGDGERLRVIIDGVPEEPARMIKSGSQQIILATNLDASVEHTVTIMKEAYATSTLHLLGFELPGGTILPPPPRPPLRIAFFGDSNMEGFSLYDEKNASSNKSNGTYFAYPAMVSRMLGAEMYLQAVGSATLDGPTPNDVVSFVHSERFGDEDRDYDDGFEPHVIVVNAGANDIYSVSPDNKKDAVKQHYRNAIAAIRDAYGDAPHIILKNAYAWDPDEPAMYAQEIVDEIGGKLSLLQFPWCWEQWHGDMVDHAGQARQLANYITSLDLGFSVQQELDVVDGYGVGFDVANGSFEGAARDNYGGFAWRYFTDGVKRVAVADAADGEYLVRLEKDELLHQCVDATGDFLPGATNNTQQYTLTASIRSVGDNGKAVLGADYEAQALYRRENLEEHVFEVSGEWRDFTATLSAPDGTWKTYIILKSAQGEVEFDNIRLSGL